MNINLDDSVKISVKEGAGIERINIRYIRSNGSSKTFHSDQLHKNKHRYKHDEPICKQLQESSKSEGIESSYTCQISPSSGCSNRPKESYFFGQNPLPKYETYEEEKESALYKVKYVQCINHVQDLNFPAEQKFTQISFFK